MTDDDEVHDYAGGEVSTRRGRVNRWLLVVYLVLLVWGVLLIVSIVLSQDIDFVQELFSG